MYSKHQLSEAGCSSHPDRRKKTEKADLENKKALFFETGLIFSLCLVLFAFEWKSYDSSSSFNQALRNGDEVEEIVAITSIAPPQPKIPKQLTTIIKVIENTAPDSKDSRFDIEDKPDDIPEVYLPPSEKPEIEVADNEIFKVVEFAPEFIGGEEARINFLRKNISYPQMARESGIQGTVHLTFVIEKTGEISDVQILRGIGGGCDEEAIRVIKAMPKWKAGIQRDKNVRVQFNLPIKFILSN